MGAYTFVTSEYWFTEEELLDIAAKDDDEKRIVIVIGHHVERGKHERYLNDFRIRFGNQTPD